MYTSDPILHGLFIHPQALARSGRKAVVDRASSGMRVSCPTDLCASSGDFPSADMIQQYIAIVMLLAQVLCTTQSGEFRFVIEM